MLLTKIYSTKFIDNFRFLAKEKMYTNVPFAPSMLQTINSDRVVIAFRMRKNVGERISNEKEFLSFF